MGEQDPSVLGSVTGPAATGAAIGGPWGAAAGGALGLAQYFLQAKPEFARQQYLAAQTQKYSPWTGLHAEAPQEAPSMLGNVMQGGVSGQNMVNSINNASASQKLAQAQAGWLNRGGGYLPAPAADDQAAAGASIMAPPVNLGALPQTSNPYAFWGVNQNPAAAAWANGGAIPAPGGQ